MGSVYIPILLCWHAKNPLQRNGVFTMHACVRIQLGFGFSEKVTCFPFENGIRYVDCVIEYEQLSGNCMKSRMERTIVNGRYGCVYAASRRTWIRWIESNPSPMCGCIWCLALQWPLALAKAKKRKGFGRLSLRDCPNNFATASSAFITVLFASVFSGAHPEYANCG